MIAHDWNYERYRTRDRLLEYDPSIMPSHPHSGGIIPYVYPWENATLSLLSHQLYEIAVQNGYEDTESNFLAKFAGNGSEKDVFIGTIDTFPVDGDEKILYFDQETGILYYFKTTTEELISSAAEDIGAHIVAPHEVYIPVRALLVEDTIIYSGDAAEYID